MEGLNLEALLVRGLSVSRKKGKPSSGRSKSRSRLTSLGQSMRRCSCRKPRHYKKECKLKGVGTSKDSKMAQSIEGKLMEDEKGDVYLASIST